MGGDSVVLELSGSCYGVRKQMLSSVRSGSTSSEAGNTSSSGKSADEVDSVRLIFISMLFGNHLVSSYVKFFTY